MPDPSTEPLGLIAAATTPEPVDPVWRQHVDDELAADPSTEPLSPPRQNDSGIRASSDPLDRECPVCHAPPGQRCVTPLAYPMPTPHRARISGDNEGDDLEVDAARPISGSSP